MFFIAESKLQFCGTDDVLLQSGATKINPPQQKPTICPLPKSNGEVKPAFFSF